MQCMEDAPRGLDFHTRVATLPHGVSPQKTGAIGSSGPGGSPALKQDSSWFLQQLLKFQEITAGCYLVTQLSSGPSLDNQTPPMGTRERRAKCRCGVSHLAVQTGKHSEPNSTANYVTLAGAFCVKIRCLFKPQVP